MGSLKCAISSLFQNLTDFLLPRPRHRRRQPELCLPNLHPSIFEVVTRFRFFHHYLHKKGPFVVSRRRLSQIHIQIAVFGYLHYL